MSKILVPCQINGCHKLVSINTTDEYIKRYCPGHYIESHDAILKSNHNGMTVTENLFECLMEENPFYEA